MHAKAPFNGHSALAARGRKTGARCIELKPSDLRIEFCGAGDLAANLFGLSQAMANDWQAFARAVEKNKGQPPQRYSLIHGFDRRAEHLRAFSGGASSSLRLHIAGVIAFVAVGSRALHDVHGIAGTRVALAQVIETPTPRRGDEISLGTCRPPDRTHFVIS